MNKATFLTLSEADQLAVLDLLFEGCHYDWELAYLTALDVDRLSVPLLNRLARAYNNTQQLEQAMATLNRIPEAERDGPWYYRYGYALLYRAFPAKNPDDQLKALALFDKACELTSDRSLKDTCLELVRDVIDSFLLDQHSTHFPFLYHEIKGDRT